MIDENSFEVDGVKLYAEEISKEDYLNLDRDVCTGCYFNINTECNFPGYEPECCSDYREDGRNVVFKKVEG